MAKKRPSRKAKPAKASSKRARKRPVKRAKPAAKPRKQINLKQLRKEFGLVLSLLSTRAGTTLEATDKLDDTRRRINQWMTDIDDICSPQQKEICGEDMIFPLPA